MHALDRTDEDVPASHIGVGARTIINDKLIRCGIAAGLRLIAEGILVIANALGATDVASSRARRSPRRVAVRLPQAHSNDRPITDSELAAAARVARRAGVLR